MDPELLEIYNEIRLGRAGFYEQRRGFIAVHGKESVQFLDGLISNDVKTLNECGQMLAAFPNAQGRLQAAVRVLRRGERFLLETEDATRETLFTNLHRFTFAGDFFVEDISEDYTYFEIFGPKHDVYHPNVGEHVDGAFAFELPYGAGFFIPDDNAAAFRKFLTDENKCLTIAPELYETFRIESGIPKFGVDMDESTIVPELGSESMISYNKGCYIGQEIIARIHFRGHVAKQMTGLILSEAPASAGGQFVGTELASEDDKPAGRITSVTYSPKLATTVALAYVRYEHLAAGTELTANHTKVTVTDLPFV